MSAALRDAGWCGDCGALLSSHWYGECPDIAQRVAAPVSTRTRELLDTDGWIDWDDEGHLVFAKGPFAGDRLGTLSSSRLGSLANLHSTPESTLDVLHSYLSVAQATARKETK